MTFYKNKIKIYWKKRPIVLDATDWLHAFNQSLKKQYLWWLIHWLLTCGTSMHVLLMACFNGLDGWVPQYAPVCPIFTVPYQYLTSLSTLFFENENENDWFSCTRTGTRTKMTLQKRTESELKRMHQKWRRTRTKIKSRTKIFSSG